MSGALILRMEMRNGAIKNPRLPRVMQLRQTKDLQFSYVTRLRKKVIRIDSFADILKISDAIGDPMCSGK